MSAAAPIDPAPSAQDDLRMMRELAEEGRTRPLLSGRHLVLFGAAIALASLLHGLVMLSTLDWSPNALPVIWLGLIVPAMVVSKLWRSGERDWRPSLGHKVEKEVWQTGGAFLGIISISTLALAYLQLDRTGETVTFYLMSMIAPITFGVYATALAASAAAGRVAALRPFAALAMAFVVATAMTAGTAMQFAVMGVGVLLVSVVPGVMLIQRENAARG
ncbi:hypothetical protein [Citromicrobium bathyomarinum]|uniref:hypothetical protein n=1 Tax=Citromicrobium bathyomarinum TaxID=72174 RepID=UPI001E313CC4|nr:hypothetical protein [Citromicrobium bathyomarinum]MCD1623880.1 hypothetical protein [Citromicrobium bathyomarinum]